MQHDFDITTVDANTGATMRTQINAALQALATNSALSTEPGTKYPFMWWADATTDTLKQRNAGNTAWVNVLTLSTGATVKVETNALAQVYPVGSIYLSAVATNPATLFGFGTWAALQNQFLIGAGGSYANGSTGGAAVHTLTTNEIPSHAHTTKSINSATAVTSSINSTLLTLTNAAGSSYSTGNESGGGESHNNMPPYLAVHMWKRTA